ncbi:hypothetical protein O3G_MSEX007868 [Manduca sexta]|uniref:Alcohol dehydrogenase n=2 Tax=Manduca sexta TaxID=7130 RepID=A0A922CNZ8_MANSE|nr:hypothetical protein O3G_MSEX007868 [Manduca sexta]
MVYEWKDKVVLITGAARGIGANVVRIALEEGVKRVVIIDVDETNTVALKNELNAKHGEGKVEFIKCDVTNEAQLTSAYKSVLNDKTNEYVVVNSAAILNDSWATYRKQIDINVTALITGSLIALDMMRADKGGKGGAIINMSSVAALAPLPYTPIYNATKSAVMQFSIALGANDYYERTRVRVLTMCFGATDTGLIALQNMGCFDEVMESRLGEALSIYPGQK